MREAGAVKALAQALKLINTEHPKVSYSSWRRMHT